MATKRQVERKLRELIERMDENSGEAKQSLAQTLPDARIIELFVPDLPATYWTELSDGSMHRLRPGPADQADIRVRVGSDDLIALLDGERSLFSSYLAGQVKIEASLSDLLRLRRLA
ncbi:MAG TPA: SCP2 sterol-binding domain-containing protein [Actinomycetota bacterium]|nr:SCP2 sterol-binding domain-containing protein [Actinomycetota bacterium]